MKVTPVLSQANGIIQVIMAASFVGDSTDATDQARIAAFGDPLVDLAGTFTDPNNTQFSFTFPASQLFVGITTQMQNFAARFMVQLPVAPPIGTPFNPFASTASWNPSAPDAGFRDHRLPHLRQGNLDCVTSNPAEAATVWIAQIDARIIASMTVLRALTPVTPPSSTTV
jgi:hypothetical protein